MIKAWEGRLVCPVMRVDDADQTDCYAREPLLTGGAVQFGFGQSHLGVPSLNGVVPRGTSGTCRGSEDRGDVRDLTHTDREAFLVV